MKLDGKIDLGTVSAIADLEHVTSLCDLRLATRVFLTWKYKGMNSDILSLLDLDIRAYCSIQIPVPNFSGEGFVLHHARCTGLGSFGVSKEATGFGLEDTRRRTKKSKRLWMDGMW